MPTQIPASGIEEGVITGVVENAGLLPPRITNVEITDTMGGTVLDDTAIDLAGGYIKITGDGFVAGSQVLVEGTPASAITVSSSTTIYATVGAKSAGSYTVFVIGPNGNTGLRVAGLTYSATPTWVTSSPLTEQVMDIAVSIQLSATGATTYSLQSGSSLPTGLTLSSGGLLSGTVTGLASDTTYNFTIIATDSEAQDSPRSFSMTVTTVVPDPYYSSVGLLMNFDGADNGTTFTDLSTNNLSITRSGAVTKTDQKKFGSASAYIASGNYLEVPHDVDFEFSNGAWTIEFWAYKPISENYPGGLALFKGSGDQYTNSFFIVVAADYGVLLQTYDRDASNNFTGATTLNGGAGNMPINTWHHVALCRSGNTLYLFVNGVLENSKSYTQYVQNSSSATMLIGRGPAVWGSSYQYNGYIDDLRITKGVARYTSNFTVPDRPFPNK